MRICCFRSMLDLLCGIVSFLFGQPAQTAVETLRSVSKAVFGAGQVVFGITRIRRLVLSLFVGDSESNSG